MIRSHPYEVKVFPLNNLNGISEKTLQMHFGLYEGYVKEANRLTEKAAACTKAGVIYPKNFHAYADIQKRLSFEHSGMILHERYFENLHNGGEKNSVPHTLFLEKINSCFGSYGAWKADFIATGSVRGVGWALCCEDPADGALSNHWIVLHDLVSLGGLHPVLVMDVWEHAFLLDYPPSQRKDYIDAFFSNIDWDAVEGRMQSFIKKNQSIGL